MEACFFLLWINLMTFRDHKGQNLKFCHTAQSDKSSNKTLKSFFISVVPSCTERFNFKPSSQKNTLHKNTLTLSLSISYIISLKANMSVYFNKLDMIKIQ